MTKIVLAYSGGLDTSCAIKWLQEKGYDVVAFIANVGQRENFAEIKRRALATGASAVHVVDLRREFVEDYVFPSLKAGAVYEGAYFLATALSRPLIAKHQVRIARMEKASAVAHGSTGKGNDQVRFETTVSLLAPDLEQIAPVRMWEFRTREEEIDYARRYAIPVDVTKKSPYSIDLNLYGRSIECGVLEDPWVEPPEEIYRLTVSPRKAPQTPEIVVLDFKQGIPRRLNGRSLSPVSLIERLNAFGGRHGVGRVDMVEDRLVGIKSREVYENPAATILWTAHRELESLTLDRETLHFKEEIARRYARLVYFGLWETPLKKALDAFVEATQERVTGTVRLKLYRGTCSVVGRKSPCSRYKEEWATYGEKDVFDQRLAEGFNRLWALPFRE